MRASVDLGSSRRRKRANSGRVEWCTPRVVLECVARLGPIALDPCGSPRSIVQAGETLCLEHEQDGLAYPWHSLNEGLIYCNPPYGQALKQWVPKILDEAALGCEIVALLPNDTDSRWFEPMYAGCDACVAWRGRLTFLGATAPAFFGSVLFYFGDRRKAFLRAFAGHAYSIKGAP